MKISTLLYATIFAAAAWVEVSSSTPELRLSDVAQLREKTPPSRPGSYFRRLIGHEENIDLDQSVSESGEELSHFDEGNLESDTDDFGERLAELRYFLGTGDVNGIEKFSPLRNISFVNRLVHSRYIFPEFIDVLMGQSEDLIERFLSLISVAEETHDTLYIECTDGVLLRSLLRHGFGPKPGSTEALSRMRRYLLGGDNLGVISPYLTGDRPITSLLFKSDVYPRSTLVFLAEMGVDLLTWKDINQGSFLHRTTCNGVRRFTVHQMREAVELLLSRGLDPLAVDSHERTPLQCALGGPDIELVRMLWEASKDRVSQIEEFCELRMIGVLLAGDIGQLRQMEVAQPKLAKRCFSQSDDLVMLALRTHNVEILELVLSAVPGVVPKLINKGKEVLQIAVEGGNPAILRLLIDAKANVDRTFFLSDSPLLVAVAKGDRTLAEILLQHGADPNSQARGQTNAVMKKAAEKGTVSMMKLLLKYGGVMDSITIQGDNLLFYTYDPDMAQFLISEGLDVNKRDSSGKKVFSEPNLPVTSSLLRVWFDNGLSLADIADDWRMVCDLLSRSFEAADPDVIDKILDSVEPLSRKVEKCLMKGLAYSEDVGVFKAALPYVKNINALLDSGHTILHYVVRGGNTAIVDLLVSRGADVNAKDEEGTPPIMDALDAFQVHMVLHLLLEHEANLDFDINGVPARLFFEKVGFWAKVELN